MQAPCRGWTTLAWHIRGRHVGPWVSPREHVNACYDVERRWGVGQLEARGPDEADPGA